MVNGVSERHQQNVALTNLMLTARPPESAETFDDDLAWITGRLASRTGGSFGFIARFLSDEQRLEILKRCDTPGDFDATICDLTQGLEQAITPTIRDSNDELSVTQISLHAPAAGQSHRLFYLRFQPAPTVTLVAVVCRPDSAGPFNTFEEHMASTLYPVLARYIRLWWLHRTERRQVYALRAVLDLSDIGVILLNRDVELMFANTKAATLLDSKDGIARSNGSIAATDDHDGMNLQALIRHAVHGNLASAGESAEAPGAKILALERRNGRRKLLVAVMNVRRVALDSQDPAVIIYVLDPHRDVRHLLAPVCTLYKLTASETRLVYNLTEGLSLDDAALAMKIRPHTARAYLKQIFGKTNTHRQADLVRLMLSSLLRTNSGIDLALL